MKFAHLSVAVLSTIALSLSSASAEPEKGQRDNSGRKLAVVLPGVKPERLPMPQPKLFSQVEQTKSARQSAKDRVVPAVTNTKLARSLEDAADVCSVTIRKISKDGSKKAMELCRWFTTWLKHVNAPPKATPVGAPYTSSAFQQKLWYMPDGRLKTVVER